MKKYFLIILLLVNAISVWACSACEKQQPQILRGITHGGGPQSNWDYLIISVAMTIVLFTLYFSVKWLVRPGEKSANHIKYWIFNNEYNGR